MFLALTHRKIFSVHWNKFPTKWLSAIFTESQCDNLLSYFQILLGISQSPGHSRRAHQPWGLVVVPPGHRQVQVLHCRHILADRNSKFYVTHVGLLNYILFFSYFSLIYKIAPRTRAHYVWLSKVAANERKRYIFNVFSHWLRTCSAIDKQCAQIIVTSK